MRAFYGRGARLRLKVLLNGLKEVVVVAFNRCQIVIPALDNLRYRFFWVFSASKAKTTPRCASCSITIGSAVISLLLQATCSGVRISPRSTRELLRNSSEIG
jgi:hypothetical protein